MSDETPLGVLIGNLAQASGIFRLRLDQLAPRGAPAGERWSPEFMAQLNG